MRVCNDLPVHLPVTFLRNATQPVMLLPHYLR